MKGPEPEADYPPTSVTKYYGCANLNLFRFSAYCLEEKYAIYFTY